MMEAVPDYTLEQYIHDLRAIRNTGAATDETSFYPAVDRLFNAAGATLDPKVLFSTQLSSQGAGMPDGGFFPQPKRNRRDAEPPPLQNPERGAVEIKPATYDLLQRPLKTEEAEYFSNVVRRIASILLLGPALDASYAAIVPTATGLHAQ